MAYNPDKRLAPVRSHRLITKVDDKTHAAVEAFALEQGLTISTVLHCILREWTRAGDRKAFVPVERGAPVRSVNLIGRVESATYEALRFYCAGHRCTLSTATFSILRTWVESRSLAGTPEPMRCP